jgi:hypothetical protein
LTRLYPARIHWAIAYCSGQEEGVAWKIGTLKSGSGRPGPGIGSITTVGFTSCLLLLLGPRFTLRARDLPWHLNVLSHNDATGVVTEASATSRYASPPS